MAYFNSRIPLDVLLGFLYLAVIKNIEKGTSILQTKFKNNKNVCKLIFYNNNIIILCLYSKNTMLGSQAFYKNDRRWNISIFLPAI